MRPFKVIAALFIVLCLGGQIYAQNTEIIAPNVFLQGMVLPTGVRYTATFVRPEEPLSLRNVSVEITLPPGAQFSQMLVPPQVEFDVVRVSREGAITMIWQTSRIPGENTLDSYSFTLAQPLTAETEFYIEWQDEDGTQHFENFFELPPLAIATQNTGIATFSQEEFLPVGETGVQVSVPPQSEPVTLTVNILPADFNPPPEFGDLWWCSLVEITGLPDGINASVIVPLRRPVAPFTSLSLFQQNDDGSWSPLEGEAFVTADGQYVVYEHPGGVVATGGLPAIQPEIIAATNIQAITDAGLVAPVDAAPDLSSITDGTSNTILLNEIPVLPPPENITDGTSNTVQFGEVQPPPQSITDGSSNTVFIGELPPAPTESPSDTTSQVTDGSSNTIIIGEATPTTSSITDGSSNTILLGEATPTTAPILPTTPPVAGQITDGSSNTIIIGEATPTVASITDGSSNTILLGEATPTTAPILPTIPPVANQIPDGSSNTIIIGEATPTVASITDGSSNTILLGEATPTTAPILPTTPPVVGQITDGSSNTILIGENTPATAPTSSNTITDGSSNTSIIGEGTNATQNVQPTSTPAVVPVTAISIQLAIPTGTPTPNLPRVIVLNPTAVPRSNVPVQPPPLNAPRIEIYTQVSFAPVQCQIGRINCVLLLRRSGGGFR